jgi:hypothetical protein
MYHPILDWRLAADTLELILEGQLRSDRWQTLREAAMTAVRSDLTWQLIEGGRRPLLDTGSRLAALCHPLEPVDGYLANASMPTAHRTGDADRRLQLQAPPGRGPPSALAVSPSHAQARVPPRLGLPTSFSSASAGRR